MTKRDKLLTKILSGTSDANTQDATNWRAEQAIRPAVVTRKVWGGNRTESGAKTQQILTSLFQSLQCHYRCSPFIVE